MRSKNAIFSTLFLFSLVFGLTIIFSSIALGQEVDQFGAFNYKYPIELPPGTNGMAPQLELVYNSNSGNGILGMGWSLTGLPVICRDPSYGIYYDDRDHYLYNGEKLIPGNDGYYHTERESFIRIEARNLNSSSSEWIFTLKNGTKMYFGSSSDSHIDAVDKGGKAYLWALKKVVDLQGNYYEVEYNEDTVNGDYYPVRITYTKNDGNPLAAYRTVEFSYEDRTDHGLMYHFSAGVDMDKRLKWITVKVGGNLLRKYRLDYEYGSSTGRSRLVAVQEYGSDGNYPLIPWVDGSYMATGNTLPTDRFTWQNSENGWTPYQTLNQFGKDSDEYTDNNYFPILTGDWNGDGKTDVGRVNNTGVIFFISSGNGWTLYQTLNHFGKDSAGYTDNNNYPIITGDWNGDGKTDVGRVYDNGVIFFISSGNGWTPYQTLNQFGKDSAGYTNNNYFPILTGDWNGDGKTDVGRVHNTGVSFFVSSGNGWTPFQMLSEFGKDSDGYTDNNNFPILTRDWNGDGKTDVGRVHNTGVSFFISSGNGWTPFQMLNHFGKDSAGYTNDNYFPIITGDWNGDGKADVGRVHNTGVIYYNSTSKSEIIHTLFFKSGGIFNIAYLPTSQIASVIDSFGKQYPNISNMSCYPIVTQISFDDGFRNVNSRYTYSNNMFHSGLPHECANLGFEWIEKTDENTGSSERTYYHQDDLDLRWLIKKEETYGSDRKLYQVKEYRYAKELIKDNSSSPEWHDVKFIYKTDDYLYNYNGEDSAPVEYRVEYRYDTYQGDLVETINHGDTATTSDDQHTVTEYITNSTDFVTLPSVVRKYAIGLDGSEGLAAETRFSYTNYLVTQKEFENGSQDVTQNYGYDDYGNLISEMDGNGHTGTITYDNIYQTFVRVVTNALGNTKETVYDHLMRPVRTIDTNGAIWETVYDEFSREKATIAPGDDAVNPTTRKNYPDEFIDTQTGEPLFPQRMKTELKESGSNYLEKYDYFDGLGRVIQQKTEAENGWITIDHYYDNSGREYRTSVPYLTADYGYTTPDDTVKHTFKEFDPVGREKAVRNIDDTIIRKVYGKLENLTIDSKGHVTGRRVNGNTEYQTSYTNVYPYHAEYATTMTEKAWDGIRITDAASNVLETRLDKLGRKVSYRDPDMGLWTYVYDANSNLTSQTDTKGQTVIMEYDAVNRLVKKEYPDGSMVRFYYDEDGHGFAKGRITRVLYPDGDESFNYDAKGRQISVTQTIGSHSRTQSMAYDSMDRVVTTTYPDGEVVQSVYNQGGNLKTLSGDLTYVNGIDYTAYGKISGIQYGNGVQTVYNYYDEAGEYDNSADTYHSYRLKQIQVSKNGGDIFNLGYEYDRAGNVKVKRDLNYSNFTEEYSYDDLNRLIGSGSPSYGYSLYRYDEINNILEKDLRSYQYSSSQPHAVTDDGRYTYTYDANGNMIGRSDGRVIAWDYENRVKSISDGGNFAYDPSGRRIKKSENGTTTYYFFSTYEEEYQDGTKTKSVKFYFAGDQRVAEYSSIEGLRYYHQDHLGSSVALTDITGTLVFRANYAPYGSDAYTQGSTSIKYKFTGQEKDGSGLYYYGARYYDPELGRFISPDVNLDGLNRYTYCHNNPVIYNDPTGEWAWVIGAIIGAWTGHEVAESKGIEVDTSDWWKHVVTGAVIGGLAGWAGEAVFTAAEVGNSLAVAYGQSGAVSGFISGFGNSWAFGGEGTELFQGDLGEAFQMGLISAAYSYGISYYAGPALEKLNEESILKKLDKYIVGKENTIQIGEGHIIKEVVIEHRNSVVDWIAKNIIIKPVMVAKPYLLSATYNSCTLTNAIMINGYNDHLDKKTSWIEKEKIPIFAKVFKHILWYDKTKDWFGDLDFSKSFKISYDFSF